jgi:hypothetical protein
MDRLLKELRHHGIYKSCHLQQFIGILPAANFPRLAYLFAVFDETMPEIVNTNGFRLYGETFLFTLLLHVRSLDTRHSKVVEMYRLKDESEKALLDLFF